MFDEIMVKNFLYLKEETDNQIQEAEGPKQDEPKQDLCQDIL